MSALGRKCHCNRTHQLSQEGGKRSFAASGANDRNGAVCLPTVCEQGELSEQLQLYNQTSIQSTILIYCPLGSDHSVFWTCAWS
jgi:hypothetical protein